MHVLSIVITLFMSSWVFAKAKALPMPLIGASLDAPEQLVEGIIRYKNRVYLTYFGKDLIVRVPFNGITLDQKKSFGEFSESNRIQLNTAIKGRLWQGGDVVGGKLILVDGDLFQVAAFDEGNGLLINSRTIPWDTIRPAADRGGEATKSEKNLVRKAFKKAYTATPAPAVAGIAYDRHKWLGKDGHHFFVATNIHGFPLITLKCQKDDPSACVVDRACRLKGKEIAANYIGGVAVASERQLYLLDSITKKLIWYAFDSCYEARRRGELDIPNQIKKPSDVYIDEENGLWISSRDPDDYYNASAYYWRKSEWLN